MDNQANTTESGEQFDEELTLEALESLSGGKNGEGWRKFKSVMGTVIDTAGNGDGTVDKKDIIPIVIKAAVIAAGGVHDPSRGSDNQDPTINH